MAMRSPLFRIGAALAVAFGAVIAFALTRDPSPLAGLERPLEAKRDLAYGADPHQRLDVAFEPGKVRPALVMFHPGGWFMGDKSAYHPLMIEYARLGYATVSVNFRPSGVARFPGPAEDCRDAVRWLRANAGTYGIDPARIGVMGYSSGAHLAVWVALTEPVQAAVAYAGVYDFLIEEHGEFPNSENDEAVVRFLGGPPRMNPDLARRASPLHHLDAKDPPLLVFHGERDRRIDVAQARQLAARSKSLGRNDEVVLIPGGDHGRDVLPPDPELRARARDFLSRHLAPTAP
jgi:acetyl esterase/lipase